MQENQKQETPEARLRRLLEKAFPYIARANLQMQYCLHCCVYNSPWTGMIHRPDCEWEALELIKKEEDET